MLYNLCRGIFLNGRKAEQIKKAYEKVKQNYNWDIISERIMNIYIDVVDNKKELDGEQTSNHKLYYCPQYAIILYVYCLIEHSIINNI